MAERSRQAHIWLVCEMRDATAGPELVLPDQLHGCAIINAATDSRGDRDPTITELSRAHLQRYRDLLEDRLAEITPPCDDPARLARQLLLLIEGATVIAAATPSHTPASSTKGSWR
jgi:BetI-type transcriptional repressor, C-terminal